MSSDPTATARPADRDPRAAIALLLHALDRMPGNVDAMVGLSGLHLQLGLLDDAAQWCGRAIGAAPGLEAAERLHTAISDAYVRRGTREAIAGRLDRAFETFSRGAALTESRPLALFRDLFALTRRWFDDAARLRAGENAVRLSIPVWGEAYVGSACTGLLRSLLASGNVPALAEETAVTVEFMTRESDREVLLRSPVLAALRRHATIAFFIIPDHLTGADAPREFSYWLMSAAHYGSAERARRSGTAASFLTADMVLSDGSYRAARRLIDEGAQAVLIRALELERETLQRSADVRGEALAIAPDDLVRMALAQVRAELPEGWGGDMDAPFDIASCAWFPIDGGVALHGFHFLPLLLSAAFMGRRFEFDLLTVDTRFVRLALGEESPAGCVKVVDDAKEIAAVSTLRAAREAPGPRLLKRERLGRWAAGWCFEVADAPYFDWCFRHRTVFRPGRTDSAPQPSAAEREAVAAILTAYAEAATGQLLVRGGGRHEGAAV